jgi:hypothetical protein
MQNTTRTRYLTIAALIVALTLPGVAAGPASVVPVLEYDFHSVVPLGSDAIELMPAKKDVYLLASAESAEFEGMKRTANDGTITVVGADGTPARRFPSTIDFRLTASTNRKKLADEPIDPYPIKATESINDYLLNLKFRLRIFHGLQMREFEPREVKMIGVPADVPYGERIYRASFDIGQVSLEDRLVLEIFDAGGTRVSKFHLEVY